MSSRSFKWREVTNLPSLPAKGELLIEKIIEIVGSSTAMRGRGFGFSGSVMVSPMFTPSMPARATMSPTVALGVSTRFRPSNAKSEVILVLTMAPLWVTTPMGSPTFAVPAKILPMARRPT